MIILDNCGKGISDTDFMGIAMTELTESTGSTESTDSPSLTLEAVPFLILAGGTGSRLAELSKDVPKAMIDIGGEPFVAHVLRLLKREGVQRVVFLVHHLAESIESYVGDGKQFGLNVSFLRDGKAGLGTGAAVKNALSEVDSDFAVMYGDTYLDIAMAPVYNALKSSQFTAMMTVLENDNKWQPSNCDFERETGKLLQYDKRKPTANMHFVDFGLTFFAKETFAKHAKSLRKESFDLGDIFRSMAKKSEMGGYAVNRRFYDIGTVENLIETRAYLSQGQLWQTEKAT